MTHLDYKALIKSADLSFDNEGAAEKRRSYLILTERHLQAMWVEQKYFKTLHTTDGLPIEVLSPGIWNSEAGPDFLKAHIRIGNQDWRGDVELHLFEEGWYRHHHHLDPNYNKVILHLSFYEPKIKKQLLTLEGKTPLIAYMQPALTISENRILKLIDLDLYPYSHFSGTGSCAHNLFNQLPKENIHSLFRSAALWRLKQKRERLEAQIDNQSYTLLGGIAMVLGYKHNSEAFLLLFKNLNLQKHKSESFLLSLALGSAGFFNEYFQKKWENSEAYQNLFMLYGKMPLENHLNVHLKLDKIRPANHPARRLAILVKMMLDPTIQRMEESLFALWSQHAFCGKKSNWKKLKNAILELIPSYEDSYWQFHYSFEKEKQINSLSLIGNDLKLEILVNICLPILYKEIDNRNSKEERETFIDFYSSLPGLNTKKTSYLNYRFFGNKEAKKSLMKADFQQGAYQIHRDFCIHFEASCQGCPFVERYKLRT